MSQIKAAAWSASTLEQRASIEKSYKLRQRILFVASIVLLATLLVLFEGLASSTGTKYQATRNRASYPTIQGPIESIADLSPDKCYSFQLMESEGDASAQNRSPALLAWTTSGLIAEDRILVADMSFSRLAKMDVGGLVESEDRYSYRNPWYLRPMWSEDYSYDGFALLDLRTVEEGRWLPSQVRLFDPSGEVVKSIVTSDQELAVPEGQEPVVLWEVQRFAPVSEGLVVNADFIETDDFKNRHGDRYWNTFAYLPWDEPLRYLPLEMPGDTGDLGGDAAERRASADLKEKFFGRDFSYMATVEGSVYVLMMEEEEPWVGRVDLERLSMDRLPDFPEDLKIPPIEIRQENGQLLPGMDRLYRLYRDVERNAMPAGLYSWRQQLFILAKTSADPQNGETGWTLVEISPETGAELGNRIVLPTSTEHLAIVSGQDFWGIIEKGPIDRLKTSAFPWSQLYRSTRSAVVFSTHSWLADQKRSSAPGHAAQCQEIAI